MRTGDYNFLQEVHHELHDALVEKVARAIAKVLVFQCDGRDPTSLDDDGVTQAWEHWSEIGEDAARAAIAEMMLASAASHLGKDQEPIQASRHVVPPEVTDEMVEWGAKAIVSNWFDDRFAPETVEEAKRRIARAVLSVALKAAAVPPSPSRKEAE